MIEVVYLVDSKGAQKFGTCASCGKGSDDDPKMVRVTYSHHDSISRTSNCLCADCRRLLLKTISDVPDRSVGEWIPVSERLPEERGFYLTTTKDKAVYCDHWNEDNFDRTEMVIAWMPLPEPYRGGNAE